MKFRDKKAFTLAEMMVVLLVLSIIMAAFTPIITKKTKAPVNIWQYVTGATGANSDIFFGASATQGAVIGARNMGTSNTRLLINTWDAIQPAITFGEAGTVRGVLRMNTRPNLRLGTDLTDPTTETGVNNTSVGLSSLSTNSSGNSNTAMGFNSLVNNSSGSSNSAFGVSALRANISGDNNTAIGFASLFRSTISRSNTAVGSNALYNCGFGASNINEGIMNTAVGVEALINNTSGNMNVAMGVQALNANNSGLCNVALGNGALNNNNTGRNNVGIGFSTNSANTTGSYNVAIGSLSRASGDDASANHFGNSIAVGTYAQATAPYTISIGGSENGVAVPYTTASSTGNIAIGHGAGAIGADNLAIGYRALHGNTASGTGNLAIGRMALFSTTNGSNNTAVGSLANTMNTTGCFNTAVGNQAQATADDGSAGHLGYSTAVGVNVLASGVRSIAIGGLEADGNTSTTASSFGSTAVGNGAHATGGNFNSAFGYQANAAVGESTTAIGHRARAEGDYSTAVGSYDADGDNEMMATGAYSSAFGSAAQAQSGEAIAIGYSSIAYNGVGDIAIGSYSVSSGVHHSIAIGSESQATASCSTALGYGAKALPENAVAIGANSKAGYSSAAKGVYSVAVGYGAQAGYNAGFSSGNGKCTAIGYQAYANGDTSTAIGYMAQTATANQILLGRTTGEETVYIPGRLFVKSNEITVNSDKRLKNIKGESKSGLEQIRKLKVYDYTLKSDKKKKSRVGIIAQDLQKIFPNAVTKEFDGFLAIRQEDMFYAMINSIKQLDVMVQDLFKQIKTIVVKIKSIDDKIIALVKFDEMNAKKIKELESRNKTLEVQNKIIDSRLKKLEKLATK